MNEVITGGGRSVVSASRGHCVWNLLCFVHLSASHSGMQPHTASSILNNMMLQQYTLISTHQDTKTASMKALHHIHFTFLLSPTESVSGQIIETH